MEHIIVVYGGRSTEHKISLRSAKSVINALPRDQYIVHGVYIDEEGRFIPTSSFTLPIADETTLQKTSSMSTLASIAAFLQWLQDIPSPLFFSVVHGQSGEDGELQGFFQTLRCPYTGSGLTASALCMDKAFANQVFDACHIPQAPYFVLTEQGWQNETVRESLQTQVNTWKRAFVKPANNGSSVGVSRISSCDELEDALHLAFRYDHKVLIEKEICGVELEISVLGNMEQARASRPGSYTNNRPVLDYDSKYHNPQLIENLPHPLSSEKEAEVRALAIRAYQALGCEGFARVDIFMDDEGNFYVNEINSIPGMTPTSLAPKLYTDLEGLSFADYLQTIIENAKQSFASRESIGHLHTRS